MHPWGYSHQGTGAHPSRPPSRELLLGMSQHATEGTQAILMRTAPGAVS